MTLFGDDGARSRQTAWRWIPLLVFLLNGDLGARVSTEIPREKVGQLQVIRTVRYRSVYSEGIDFYQGHLWQALAKAILKIDPKDGRVVQEFVPPTEYSESVAWFGDSLWNVSFANNGLFRGRLQSGELVFKKVGDVPEIHAWGLTHNGQHLILTGDYSDKLYFMDPKTHKLVRTVQTNRPSLEDLAWDGKYIWASSFTAQPGLEDLRGQIFRIHPDTGHSDKRYSLPDPESCPVIDGIAYDGSNFWVTGKHCGALYYVKRPE